MLVIVEYLKTPREHWVILTHLAVTCTVLVAIAVGGCAVRGMEKERSGRMQLKTIEQVQQEHTDAWMAVPGVVGTAIGQCKGKPCILIFTTSSPEHIRRTIPSTVEGYPVVVERMGEIRALDTP